MAYKIDDNLNQASAKDLKLLQTKYGPYDGFGIGILLAPIGNMGENKDDSSRPNRKKFQEWCGDKYRLAVYEAVQLGCWSLKDNQCLQFDQNQS